MFTAFTELVGLVKEVRPSGRAIPSGMQQKRILRLRGEGKKLLGDNLCAVGKVQVSIL
jgi:hypothetical protein